MPEKVAKKVKRIVIKRAVPNRGAQAKPMRGVGEVQKAAVETGEAPIKAKKTCAFCDSKTLPLYTDVNSLRRFLTERSKIVPKLRSGLCSKHQRRLTTQVKYARHLGLLPFTPRV